MSVSLITGCMFSGKSTELFRRIRNERYAGKKIQLFKYSKDVRYNRSSLACSHDGIEEEAVPIDSFKDVLVSPDIQVIGIDEGQFIEGLVEFCDYHANAGRRVIVAALDSNFLRDPFQQVTDLVAICEHVTKLHAVCIVCKSHSAVFSRRLDQKKTSIEDIGGADKYIASCRKCFYKDIPKCVLQEYWAKIK